VDDTRLQFLEMIKVLPADDAERRRVK